MSTSNNITKAGEVFVKPGKKGKVEIWSYNHEHGRPLHVGSIVSNVYEKVGSILRNPEPSFCLQQGELTTVIDNGAVFMRIVCQGWTYGIALEDFQNHAVKFYLPKYGYQLRAPLTAFQSINSVKPRNARRDNPPMQTAPLIVPRQLPMFGR
jgi:hypothetical protein